MQKNFQNLFSFLCLAAVLSGCGSGLCPLNTSRSSCVLDGVQWVSPLGILDTSFGTGGWVTTSGVLTGSATSLVQQADGKLVLGGTSANDYALVRFTKTGVLDTSFGTAGITTLNISATDNLNALANQGTKILAAGFSGAFPADFSHARFSSNGILDTSFGAGGSLTTAVSGANDNIAMAIGFQSSGSIITAGYIFALDCAVTRHSSDGVLDTSFGTAGIVTNDFNALGDLCSSVKVLPDDSILVGGGTAQVGLGADFALMKLTPNGALDTTFGTGGETFTDFTGSYDISRAMAIQSDGKIVLCGYADPGSGGFSTSLARYTSNGILDTTFGTAGKTTTSFNGINDDYSYAIAVQPDDKIIIAGWKEPGATVTLARYSKDGILDTTFGTAGLVITPIPTTASARAIVLDPSGKIYVGGSVTNGPTNFLLLRYR